VSDGFERLSRTLGRRSLLKAAFVGVGLLIVKPFRASAQVQCPAGFTPCGERCCNKGVACLDPVNSRCGCQPGYSKCGDACCPAGHACHSPQFDCCCAPGTTPCGSTCCKSGVVCMNHATGECGCPSGYITGREADGTLTCCQITRTPGGQQWRTGCPPASANAAGCSCRRYADPCDNDGQCCSGRCNEFKSDACGCVTDADCPSTTPYCDSQIGICDTSPPGP
jgi:hypothetical protein